MLFVFEIVHKHSVNMPSGTTMLINGKLMYNPSLILLQFYCQIKDLKLILKVMMMEMP